MAITKTLSQFKNRLAGGGAPSNLFEVSIPSFPSSLGRRFGETEEERERNLQVLGKSNQAACLNYRWKFPFLSEVES